MIEDDTGPGRWEGRGTETRDAGGRRCGLESGYGEGGLQEDLSFGPSASHPSSREVGGPRGLDSPSPPLPRQPWRKGPQGYLKALHQKPGPWTVIQSRVSKSNWRGPLVKLGRASGEEGVAPRKGTSSVTSREGPVSVAAAR